MSRRPALAHRHAMITPFRPASHQDAHAHFGLDEVPRRCKMPHFPAHFSSHAQRFGNIEVIAYLMIAKMMLSRHFLRHLFFIFHFHIRRNIDAESHVPCH